MLLDLDTWIAGKLTTALSSMASVWYWYPNSFETLPVVAYHTKQSASDMDYQDDVASTSDCMVDIDLYVSQSTDDTTIAQAIEDCMSGLLFNLDTSIPIPDPDAKTIHRNLQFTRAGVAAADLV
jgi:hypothetical protein